MDNEQSPNSQTGATKKKKEDKKIKRDPRSLENILKSLLSNTTGEKLEVLQEKYREIFNELRVAKVNVKVLERQIETLQKEKEHSDAELTKSVLARTKMEALARELQKQNKDIKEENYNRLKEEEEKRKAVAANFTEKLNTLTSLMDENRDKSLRLREENLNMTSKLTELYNQFQDKEVSLANMNKQVELQKKLSETQLKKFEVEFEAEREVWAKERAMLLTNLDRSEEANSLLQENIKALQSHIDSYQKQYCDFENTMQRSNKVFDTFKQEMQKLQKMNAELEKDRDTWQSHYTTSTQSMLRLTTTIEQKNREYAKIELKLQALDSLCRRLSVERTAYINQLKANNIAPITPGSEEDVAVSAAAGQPTAAFTALSEILNIPQDKQDVLLGKTKMFDQFKDELKTATEFVGQCMEDCGTCKLRKKVHKSRIQKKRKDKFHLACANMLQLGEVCFQLPRTDELLFWSPAMQRKIDELTRQYMYASNYDKPSTSKQYTTPVTTTCEGHAICKKLEEENFELSSDECTPPEEIDFEDGEIEPEDESGSYIPPGTYDEQSQQCFARVPPMTMVPEQVAEDVSVKFKGKSKKSGTSIVKRGRDPARGKDDIDSQEINHEHQKPDTIGDTAEGASATVPFFPTLKPYDLHCATNTPELKPNADELGHQLAEMVLDTGDQSLLPECDIGIATQPNVRVEPENVADGSDEPESNITQEAKD